MSQSMGLVADVGRHSVRFALTGGPGGVEPREVLTFSTKDHPTFTNALVAYLERVGAKDVAMPSVLAVAGLTRGDIVNVTGSRWFVSLSGVEAVLRARPRALNECAANALALTLLPPSDFAWLPGPTLPSIRPGGTYLVVGPGTGLGVAALVSDGDRLLPLQTEAGHLSFAARTDAEQQVVAHLMRRGVPVSNETLLSAVGLVNIYGALAPPGTPVPTAEQITRGALRDPVAHRVLALFVEAMGSAIGDYALAYGAWDGVFLTGALARALASRFGDPAFRRRLEEKDAFKRQLASLPIAVVKRGDLELLGAAAALDRG